MPDKRLSQLRAALHRIDPRHSYYILTLLGKPNGHVQWSTDTEWVGWAADGSRREVRQASLVKPVVAAKLWDELHEPYIVINVVPHLAIFIRLGGHALIEKSIAAKYFGNFLAPKEQAYDGPFGFKDLKSVSHDAFRRSPTPKQRMRVIKRDGGRCRVCGRRPADHTDIEIHVHHIRPWGSGGLTEDENLITLCHTCHNGLAPHHDYSLYELVDTGGWSSLDRSDEQFREGVRLYRQITARVLEDLQQSS